MFEFIRTHTRLVLGFMLLLIIPSFVFFGIDGYQRSASGANTTVAKVAGLSITRAEWEYAHQRAIDRVRRQDPTLVDKSLDTPAARRETLETLVRDRVLMVSAQDMHLAPTDGRLKRLFATDPQFAPVRNPDGSVNRDLLALQGMTSEGFAQQLRQDLALRQVTAGVTRTDLTPPGIAAAWLDPLLQRREVQMQRFDPATYRGAIQPTDAEVEAFYKSQAAAFRAPEQADIEYVVLDLEVMSKGITVTEDDMRKFYADNAARYTALEERRASHVLIKADKDASSADKAKAKARAEELLAQARKNPSGFAELARKNSQDEGSAAQGGDLDFFGRGAMVKPFEDTAFALKQGEISDVFQTDFGFHFLTVTAVRGGEKKSFESVRTDIEADLRANKARAEWAKAAEQFTNTVYEQSDSLQPVIDKLKLQKKTATVRRGAADPQIAWTGLPKFQDALFSSETVANKRNTDAVEVAPNQLVSARVVKHLPARNLPLAEVKDQVRERLIAQQAAEQARKAGQARLAALKASPDEALATPLILSRAQTQGAPRSVIDAVMQVDATKLPAVLGVDLQSQGYLVLRVMRVLPREPAPGGDEALRIQLAQAWTAAEADAYLAALKRRYKAEIEPDATMASESAPPAGR